METERPGYERAASFCHGPLCDPPPFGRIYNAIKLFRSVSFTVRPSGSR